MELLLRARELAVARKRRESRALVERAEPGSAEELSLAASVLVELRDSQAALPLARRAVALAPDDWRGHLAVADATFQLRWWGESAAAARRAVALAPEEAAAHRALGVALNRRIGGGREARREVKRARELGGRGALRTPGRRSPWWLLPIVAPLAVAVVLSAVGDWPDAVEDLMLLARVVPPVLVLLLIVMPSRAGLTWSERIAELRAVNEERYGDGGRAARRRAGPAAMPWGCALAVGAGLLAVPAADGDPLSASVVVPAVLIGGGALVILARRTVRLWYGERFLRDVFVPSVFVRVHLVAAGVLGGGVVLLTLGDAPPGPWRVLLIWSVVWFLFGMISALFVQGLPESEQKAVDQGPGGPEKEPADS
ncbi:M48 family metallopeptidase [Streptomyces sp. NBC_00620]|uniref:tetratricopeptide repeat protein n=1 Tax=Streptomyces sp. NBC_00620 TaxID=2903666 RepID=UPI0022549C4F|nr:hypothetical protein [Streptomyces sp. NBC_00620]MCX4974026.1 hypothetical protein [Streptomyces sp. NBC_00620]